MADPEHGIDAARLRAEPLSCVDLPQPDSSHAAAASKRALACIGWLGHGSTRLLIVATVVVVVVVVVIVCGRLGGTGSLGRTGARPCAHAWGRVNRQRTSWSSTDLHVALPTPRGACTAGHTWCMQSRAHVAHAQQGTRGACTAGHTWLMQGGHTWRMQGGHTWRMQGGLMQGGEPAPRPAGAAFLPAGAARFAGALAADFRAAGACTCGFGMWATSAA